MSDDRATYVLAAYLFWAMRLLLGACLLFLIWEGVRANSQGLSELTFLEAFALRLFIGGFVWTLRARFVVKEKQPWGSATTPSK